MFGSIRISRSCFIGSLFYSTTHIPTTHLLPSRPPHSFHPTSFLSPHPIHTAPNYSRFTHSRSLALVFATDWDLPRRPNSVSNRLFGDQTGLSRDGLLVLRSFEHLDDGQGNVPEGTTDLALCDAGGVFLTVRVEYLHLQCEAHERGISGDER